MSLEIEKLKLEIELQKLKQASEARETKE